MHAGRVHGEMQALSHLSVAMPRVMSRMTCPAFFMLNWISCSVSSTRPICSPCPCSVSAVRVPTCAAQPSRHVLWRFQPHRQRMRKSSACAHYLNLGAKTTMDLWC